MGERPFRLTVATLRVLQALLKEPAVESYGLQLCLSTSLPSGTVYPILARLEGAGWLTSRWESLEPDHTGRPRRRYYVLSDHGIEHARRAVSDADTRFAARRMSGFAMAGGGLR